jgi:hypothetical protein
VRAQRQDLDGVAPPAAAQPKGGEHAAERSVKDGEMDGFGVPVQHFRLQGHVDLSTPKMRLQSSRYQLISGLHP